MPETRAVHPPSNPIPFFIVAMDLEQPHIIVIGAGKP